MNFVGYLSSPWVYWTLTSTYVLSIITVIGVVIGENRNPLKSLAWVTVLFYDLLTEQIASLSHMPERCSHPRDLALAAKGYRCLLVEKYLVFYVVAGDTVQIRRIIYGRRDYSSLL